MIDRDGNQVSQGSAYAAFKKRAEEACVPAGALIELTHKCNFRCVHCYESNHNRRDELSSSEWRLVIDRLKSAGVIDLNISGGEFLLRGDHRELAAYARERGFRVVLLTNGSLVTREIAMFWRDVVKPVAVEVSIYGATSATHEAVTGTRKGLSQVEAGLIALAEAELPVKLKVIALSLNLEEVEAMVGLAKRYGFECEVSGRITHRDDGSWEPLRYRIPKERWAAFHAEHEHAHGFTPAEAGGKPCSAARTGLVVGPNGDVYPCIDTRKAVGNLARQTLDEFWWSDPLVLAMRKVTSADFTYEEGYDYLRDRVACMAHNLYTTGTLTGAASPDALLQPTVEGGGAR